MDKSYGVEDGFKHQKLIILPSHITDTLEADPLTNELYPVYVGYFPFTDNHYVNRVDGLPHYILLYCIAGIGHIRIGNHEHTITKNQLFIINVNTPHTYWSDSKHPWQIYWTHFTGTKAHSFVDLVNCSNSSMDVHKPNQVAINQYFNELIHLLEMGYAPDHLYHCSSLLRSILTRINHTSFHHKQSSMMAKDCVTDTIFYMQEHINEQITLDALAEVNLISKNHLMNLFREKTNHSPIDYFIHLKIQKACLLLSTTNHSVKQIAYDLGYSDPYYFSRVFKSIMTISPKNYRINNKTARNK